VINENRDIKGEIVANFKDGDNKTLDFRGYVEYNNDESDITIEEVTDDSGNYYDIKDISEYEIISYESR